MKYCDKCMRIYTGDEARCTNCKKELISDIKPDASVVLINTGGFDKDRIVAALKDSDIPFVERIMKKERSADIVTGYNNANVSIIVPYAAWRKAQDLLIGIGAVSNEDAQIIADSTQENISGSDEKEDEIPQLSPAKRALVKVISVFLLLIIIALVVWGTDYIMGFIKGLF